MEDRWPAVSSSALEAKENLRFAFLISRLAKATMWDRPSKSPRFHVTPINAGMPSRRSVSSKELGFTNHTGVVTVAFIYLELSGLAALSSTRLHSIARNLLSTQPHFYLDHRLGLHFGARQDQRDTNLHHVAACYYNSPTQIPSLWRKR
jgi:hypothetical protein